MADMKDILKTGAIVIGAASIGYLSIQHGRAAHPPSEGVTFLTEEGYKDISGGEILTWHSCGKGTVAREYQATDPENHRVTKTVCFGLFGPQFQIFD